MPVAEEGTKITPCHTLPGCRLLGDSHAKTLAAEVINLVATERALPMSATFSVVEGHSSALIVAACSSRCVADSQVSRLQGT
jgi:hypothetical protein